MQEKKIHKELVDKGLFVDDQFLVFIYKKTQRIATAIYLVTNLIQDEEPLKWKLRHSTLSLLGKVLPLRSDVLSVHAQSKIIPYASELLSLLDVGRSAHLISEMNYEVLENELETLVKQLNQSLQVKGGSEGSFIGDLMSTKKIDRDIISNDLPEIIRRLYTIQDRPKKSSEYLHKGHFNIKDKSSANTSNTQEKTRKSTIRSNVLRSGASSRRKTQIINILKEKSKLTVTEISAQIDGFSSKTIQRDLSSLLSSGVVKSEGSRRWTKYSLM